MSSSGTPVKNKGIIRLISAHLDVRRNKGHKVHLQYVKGHSGDIGNDGADAMANLGALLPEVEERDWDQLEKDLKKIEKTSQVVKAAPIEVEEPDIRAKIRKVSSVPKNTDVRDANRSKSSAVPTPEPISNPALVMSQPLLRNPPISSLRYPSSHTPPLAPGNDRVPTTHAPPDDPALLNSAKNGSSSRHPVMKVLAVVPPLIPIRAQDINVNVSVYFTLLCTVRFLAFMQDYADCLDDDDWANDLTD